MSSCDTASNDDESLSAAASCDVDINPAAVSAVVSASSYSTRPVSVSC